jgi:sugar O-acyltransferase (sialic acid O-acetyltransferase NeuD family)
MVLQSQQTTHWEIEGFADDLPSDTNLLRLAQLGSSVVSPVAALATRSSPFMAIIAVGKPQVRAAIDQALRGTQARFPNLIHPDATLGVPLRLSDGVVIAAGARLSTNISLGRHVQIDQNATVGHDTQIGDFARLNPQACVSGSVSIGEQAFIGANAVILPGVRVGAGAVVGASACVVSDVEAGAVVKGVPAR